MLSDLDSGNKIAAATDQLLRAASAYGRFPTPVEDLIGAAKLTQPEQSLLSDSLINSAPKHIREALTSIRLKVRALLDRKAREIHLHPEVERSGQKAFKQLHEVGHDILPWQRELAYADDDSTLSWSTDRLFEQEANQAAAELLFQRETFTRVANDYEIGIASIIDLSQKFGSSIHAAFRRYIEVNGNSVAGLTLETSPVHLAPLTYQRKEVVHSDKFNVEVATKAYWPRMLKMPHFTFLPLVKMASTKIVETEIDLPAINGCTEPRRTKAEVFSNSFNVFVLIWVPKRQWLKQRRVLVSADLSSSTHFNLP
jgi:hypothetical protein